MTDNSTMNDYTVSWRIELSANTPSEAALMAADIVLEQLTERDHTGQWEVHDEHGNMTAVNVTNDVATVEE